MDIYFTNERNRAKILLRHRKGLLYKVYSGIYVKEVKHIYIYIEEILEKLGISGVVFYRSALEYPKGIQNNELFIVSDASNKKVVLGENRDLCIHVFKKTNPQLIKVTGLICTNKKDILIPSIHYAILINFSISSVFEKRANKDLACERIIDSCMNSFKDIKYIDLELGKIKADATKLDLLDEYANLEVYINTYIEQNYKAYDEKRVKLFNALKEQLQFFTIESFPKAHENILFYEAYFSNYIEGTEFEIEEAEKIVFNPRHRYERHKDGHDVISTYKIVKDIYEKPLEYNTFEEFRDALKEVHTRMFTHRSEEIIVGDFKKIANVSGNLKFVIPSLVNNTLKEGFEIFKELKEPFHKAIFIHLLIAEVHPFDDGNGRLSRIFLNNELSKAGINHIVIPTVFRDDYITALKGFSHQGNPNPIISALIKAYKITNSINWSKSLNDINSFIRDNSGFEKDINSIWGILPQQNNIEPEIKII